MTDQKKKNTDLSFHFAQNPKTRQEIPPTQPNYVGREELEAQQTPPLHPLRFHVPTRRANPRTRRLRRALRRRHRSRRLPPHPVRHLRRSFRLSFLLPQPPRRLPQLPPRRRSIPLRPHPPAP